MFGAIVELIDSPLHWPLLVSQVSGVPYTNGPGGVRVQGAVVAAGVGTGRAGSVHKEAGSTDTGMGMAWQQRDGPASWVQCGFWWRGEGRSSSMRRGYTR